MYQKKTLPKYWQSLCGESIGNAVVALETDSQDVLIEAIQKGLGIGVVSADIVANNHADIVQVMPNCTENKEIWLVVHPDSYRNVRVKKLVEAITTLFKC
jgi:DNA-binding transcriptional LysR family regulator